MNTEIKDKVKNLSGFIKWIMYLLIFIILLGLPFYIQSNTCKFGTFLKNTIHIGKPGNWLGFWGSYLGSILAIVFSSINTAIQLKKNKEQEFKRMEAIDLRSLMTIITERKNEYENSKRLATELSKAITKKNLAHYIKLLSSKELLLSSYLNKKEMSHVNKWNEHFVIFDDTDSKIDEIIKCWNKIGELLENYQKTIDIDLQDLFDNSSILLSKSLSELPSKSLSELPSKSLSELSSKLLSKLLSELPSKSLSELSSELLSDLNKNTFDQSTKGLEEMESLCGEIYHKLHKLYDKRAK
ncbi:hypothetical protein [Lactobacillus apis]|uniref:hypothetical protein n=1 Tax=Lactobacillus apis TaxID=303541 RepID=UPI00242B9FCB|nr:hypothetical protein [Lactobacillus apis]